MNSTTFIWLISGITGLAFAAGGALLAFGLRGRRVGTELHCRRCGYNLTGLTSERCPECGVAATDSNVIHGIRRRKLWMITTGIFLLAISFGIVGFRVYTLARGTNLYACYPTFALTFLAKAEDGPALTELVQRVKVGTVANGELASLIHPALESIKPESQSKFAGDWLDLLAALDAAGQLSLQQQERLRDQVTNVQFEFRPRVRAGESLYCEIEYSLPLPTSNTLTLSGECRIVNAEIRVGSWTHRLRDETQPVGLSINVFNRILLPKLDPPPSFPVLPGKYPIEFHGVKIFDNPDFTSAFSILGELEILPCDTPDTVRLVDQPELRQQIQDAIHVTASNRPSWSSWREPVRTLEISYDCSLPMTCAFDLFARTDQGEIHVYQCVCKKLTTSATSSGYLPISRSLVEFRLPDEIPNTFIPILRASAEVARHTVDIFEIWNGELIYEPVTVPPPPHDPPSP